MICIIFGLHAKSSSRYTDHTYMVMTLQKLVHLHTDSDNDSGSDDDSGKSNPKKPLRIFESLLTPNLNSHKWSKKEARTRLKSVPQGVSSKESQGKVR
jgi:hypothetical protein